MVTLSQKQVQRLRVIEKAVDGRLSVSEAAHLLQRSERQVQRLKRRFQPDSTDWLVHGNTGRAKPWALALALRQQVIELARTRYAGFNDSHLHQKLVEPEGLTLSRETLRRMLRAAGLASPQKRRARKYRARRQRRPRFGLMLLTDASRPMPGSKTAARTSPCSAFRTTPPAGCWPPASNPKPKMPSATSVCCAS